jgi:pyruvate kinase
MLIRTKIVATVGPASGDAQTLRKLVDAGVDVFRINFSHGTYEEHQQYLDNIRQVERECETTLGVFGDLCGPKIRIGAMAGGGAML